MRSFSKVGSFTLLSRLLGFARDLLIAHLYGADGRTDAFFVAFKIPNLLRRLFVEGGFAAALVPTLSDYRQQGQTAALRRFADQLWGHLLLLLLLLVLLTEVLAPWLLTLFAPGFAGDALRQPLALEMLRITTPYLLFITLTALSGSLLHVHQHFALPAFTPVLLNLSMIACALWMAPRLAEPITALAWGVLIAGVAQLSLQLPILGRLGLWPRPRLDWQDTAIRQLFRRMLPALLGVSTSQLNLLLNTWMASFLGAGAISWLYYAERLMEFPLGILAVALSTVLLPQLSQLRHAADQDRSHATLDWGLRWGVMLGLPSAVGLALLAEPIMVTLFLSPDFNSHDVSFSAQALAGYAWAIPALVLVKVLAAACYAHHDTRTPLRQGLWSIGVNLLFSLLLMGPMGPAGLAVATSLASWFNAIRLYQIMCSEGRYRPLSGWRWRGWRVAVALVLMAALLRWGALLPGNWADMERVVRLQWLLVLMLGGIACYVAVLVLMGSKRREWWPDQVG